MQLTILCLLRNLLCEKENNKKYILVSWLFLSTFLQTHCSYVKVGVRQMGEFCKKVGLTWGDSFIMEIPCIIKADTGDAIQTPL